MMKRRPFTTALLGIAVSLFLAAQPFAAGEQPKIGAQPHESGQPSFYRITRLLGETVKDQQGQDLGRLEDMIASHGRVYYLIISPPGSSKLIPLPVERSLLKMKGPQIIARVSKEEFDNAPGFQPNQWPNFSQEGYRQRIQGYYSKESGKKQQ